MSFIKRNYGWMIVALLALLPMIVLAILITVDLNHGLSITLADGEEEGRTSLEMLYHVSGEFAIRWMTAVLTCTPVFILFGVHSLFVRQALGIASAMWSILHFVIFIWAEGFVETFSQFNYIAGFVAVLLLIPLLFTSNRKSMKKLKDKWKKLQSLAYVAILLSLLHVAILDKTWAIYALIVGIGFIIRIPSVKEKIIALRTKKS
ncbi:ferric reductase-like transmembrane domain-containing protein [Algoriphagus aquimarinus]|uniref:Sulfoxide reductase heme-binding subunit YedZ n=1 Tax=Algoriphagus aquimarinus TaxID=237018 RepID=A0A1I1A458_9BACT|nr:ferric reductase [Algoriphagus aquimarinus]SFB32749.1 sulfoxide reductase heme-binding subunit YedZ [Algoriphagus aquimarinus]